MNIQVAQRLAELRRAKGFSQESLARELGVSRQAVSKWERAESSPDTDNLIALARLYGVSLDDLLGAETAAGAVDAPGEPVPPPTPDAEPDRRPSDAPLRSGRARGGRGPFRSFPYGVVAVILFFVIGLSGSFGNAWLVFLTIPIYYWIAGIADDELARRRERAEKGKGE